MPIYIYQCPECEQKTERLVRNGEVKETTICGHCGGTASKVPAPCNWSFGWRLSDESHIKGHKDELVRDI